MAVAQYLLEMIISILDGIPPHYSTESSTVIFTAVYYLSAVGPG